ncbi:MAG: GntR family transcriptional regulator [Actinobacteria bacterium]|nr:GntR family transcriptional regulator [Actinomycetota bacterium]
MGSRPWKVSGGAVSEVRSVSPIRQRHLWEQIADELRAAILSGEMAPGTRLITAELAERWGVSRGPVREALMALENEGIVVSTRRHGTVVGTTSIVDLEEVLSVREAVETFAAVEVCNLGDEISQADLRKLGDLLKKIEAEKEQGKYEAARNHDFDFHQALVDLAGNSRFSGIYRQMLSQNRHHVRAIDPSRWPLVGWADMRALHYAIFDAVVAGDEEAVRAAIAEHYRHARWRASEPFVEKVPPISAPKRARRQSN